MYLIRVTAYPWLPPQTAIRRTMEEAIAMGDELIAMGYRVENREDDGTEEVDKWLNQ